MRFAIRDDDINYFTKPQELERLYYNIWDICPISLSIVPFHACTKSGAIPSEFWQGDKIFPISKNRELIAFLKEKLKEGKICIMLHGYSHKNYENGYEFEAGENLYQKVKEGKEYLEELFGISITTFVPPHHVLSRPGIKVVVKNQLNIADLSSLRPWKSTFETKRLYYLIINKKLQWENRNESKLIYPFPRRYNNHKEIGCYSLIPFTKLADLISGFDFAKKYNGDFCLATHYWELLKIEAMRETLNRLWDYINRFDKVQFCKMDDILQI
jgi:hypothetical protein